MVIHWANFYLKFGIKKGVNVVSGEWYSLCSCEKSKKRNGLLFCPVGEFLNEISLYQKSLYNSE